MQTAIFLLGIFTRSETSDSKHECTKHKVEKKSEVFVFEWSFGSTAGRKHLEVRTAENDFPQTSFNPTHMFASYKESGSHYNTTSKCKLG